MLEDALALFKGKTKLRSKDDSVASIATNVFNKLGEHKHSTKNNHLKKF